jgi:hypothetical protein
MKTRAIAIICVAILFSLAGFSQKKDSATAVLQPVHKNVIKFNPTPMILWSAKNVTFSYERVLSPRQSVSIELGFLTFGEIFEDTVINIMDMTGQEEWGLNATLEYRFYLTKLGTRPVPAGLYIGPYLTHYQYHFKNEMDIVPLSIDSAALFQGDFWSFNLGFELGYQFVFWKRMTLDLILVGPSISYYGGKTQFTGELDPDQVKDLNEEFYNKLVERYPAFGVLAFDETFQQEGKLDIFRWGFRYLIQIGFHF